MTAQSRRTFTLAEDQVEFVDRLIESGQYESVEEVIAAGIDAVKSKDERYQEWLRKEVGEAYDEAMAHPECLIGIGEAFAGARARHAARMAEKG